MLSLEKKIWWYSAVTFRVQWRSQSQVWEDYSAWGCMTAAVAVETSDTTTNINSLSLDNTNLGSYSIDSFAEYFDVFMTWRR